MQLKVQLDGVTACGRAYLRDARHWPIWFALTGNAPRFLAGDVTSSDWFQAPGVLEPGERLAWQHQVAGRLVERQPRIPAGLATPDYWVGYALLYCAGGVHEQSALALYRELTAAVHAVLLAHAAHAYGLSPLLQAFGGQGSVVVTPGVEPGPRVDLARLRKGIDPQILDDVIDRGLARNFEAFDSVARVLSPLMPGASVRAQSVPGEALSRDATRTRGPSGAPLWAEATRGARPVIAATMQAWPVNDIPFDQPLEFARALPARDAPRASLRLRGRVTRSA